MKIFKAFILIILILNYTTCYSQDTKMNKEVEEIILLGKDSIVQLALTLFHKEIAIQNFSKIKVMANSSKVYVSFLNPIKYLPMKSAFYFDVGVDILEQTTTHGPIYNGISKSEKKIQFYKETEETKKNIQFVLEAINKSDEVGSIDIVNFEDDMIIREDETYYNISVVSESQESFYKIEKMSGKIYDSEHAHLVPVPIEYKNEDTLKEIH